MEKVIYRVLSETVETRTSKGDRWTEQELLDDYHSKSTLEPSVLLVSLGGSDAEDYYDELEPATPYERKTSIGWVLEYEVIILEKIKVDENWEFIELLEETIKAKGVD